MRRHRKSVSKRCTSASHRWTTNTRLRKYGFLAHTAILRWVQRYVPECEKRQNRYARPVNGSWRCDETYIRLKDVKRMCIEQWTSTDKLLISCEANARCGRCQTVLQQGDP